MEAEAYFSGHKSAGLFSRPLPSSDKIKNAWSYTFIPTTVFMAYCLSLDQIGHYHS
jgi:hypothetical protein